MNIYPNLTKWENEPSVEDLKQQYESSQSDRSIHINNVSRWLDNLYVRGAAVPKTKDGRSKHVPKLIRKQAEWRYASLSEPFLSTDDVFNVSPVTAEDREGAIQNELILNYQFNNKIDKIRFIDQYVRTAVNEGTVVLRLGWEFKEEERETVEEVLEFSQPETEEELAKMVSLIELLQSGNIDTSEVPNEFMEAAKLSVAQGYPVYPRFSTHPVTRMTTVANHPTVQICHYKNITIDPTCGDDFSKASFVIYSFDTTIAELKADGRYKNLDYINVGAASAVTAANADLNTNGNSNFQFKDDVQKKLVAHEYWGYRDVYGTGKLECIVATYVGNVMIRMEVNPYPDKELPFLVIPYLPVTDSIYGEPDGELLEDNQRIIGAVTRGMVDVMGRSANGQQGTRKDALDVANRRKFMKGEDYEFNGNVDPRQAFHMHTYPEIPQSASLMLQIQHNDADSLTGVKAFSNGITGQALGTMLDINTLVPKSDGTMVKLAEIKDGDEIIGSNGEFTKVVKAHEISYPKAAFDITFSNGATIKSGVEHLWTVKVTGTYRKLREWHTVDTKTLMEYFLKYSNKDDCNIYIPRITRPRTTNTTVSLDPYVLGAWLGDGNSQGARFTTEDSEIVDRFISAGFPVKKGSSQNSGNAINYDIMDKTGNITNPENGYFISNETTLHNKLKSLNLLKRYGGEKHIPEEYFKADYYIKLELLRGLMDTDGYAHSGSFNVFCQTEGRLKDDVIRLLYSMGTVPKISKCVTATELNSRKANNKTGLQVQSNKTLYEIGFTLLDNPFYLHRKAKKYKSPKNTNTYRITSMVEVDKVLMRCLTVDSTDKLYAVGKEFTLTHNTATAVRSALDATSKRELGILRRLAEGIKKVGRKFISMNAVFLSEEEVIRVTASEFVRIRRDDLAGSYDLKLTISTAEADNQKAEELSFMAQTLGTNAGIELYKLILSDIARLRKLPDLAKKIKEYQPAEDPIAQQRAQLELALMQVEIEERRARAMMAQAEAQLAMAKAQTEGVKAGNIQSDTDLKNLNFIEQESGTKQERDLQKLGAQAKGNMGLELLKKGLETDTNSGINQGLTSI